MLCALALLFVGFAHQPPSLAGENKSYAAYRLPDGTMPSLCITLVGKDGKDSGDHRLHVPNCEACRINAAVLLPAPGDATGAQPVYELPELPHWKAEAFHRQIYPPNTGPRAPPSYPVMT
jgi:hypothetical protein